MRAQAPYRRLLARMGAIAVWRVDGHAIRDGLDVEFTNGAHHFWRPYVPLGEIWLDREARGADEWPYWALHQRIQRELMAAGAPYLKALRIAERIEIRERRRARGLAPGHRPTMDDIRSAARRKLLGRGAGRQVWLVDGKAVRDLAYVHFTLGGHGWRYRFIPKGEIWIDDAVAPAERPAILHHELVEVAHMATSGLCYDDAHAQASRAETRFRRHADARLL